MAKKATTAVDTINVPQANLQLAAFYITGTSPLVQNKFSKRVLEQMMRDQEEGGRSKARNKRDPKEFDKLGWEAAHVSDEGWYGVPCAAFRNAMISACRSAGIVMVRAKQALFVLSDGLDENGHDELVRITKGDPKIVVSPVRLATGVIDLRPRPHFAPGWEAKVVIRYDADMLGEVDVANLLTRAGMQVGVGEGRHDSKKSNGQGWGCFEVGDAPHKTAVRKTTRRRKTS